MKKTALILPLLLAAALLPCRAQLSVALHGGATLPQGFYADSRMSDNEWMLAEGHQHKAGAGRGWSAGIDIAYAIPALPDLEALLSASFMQSPVADDVQEYYNLKFTQRYRSCPYYEMQLPSYRNIPILLGIRYGYPLGGIFRFYGEALAGLNIRMITDWTMAYSAPGWPQGTQGTLDDYSNTDLRTYSRATTFAFRFGAGFLIKDIAKCPLDFRLGASYNILGAAPLSWDRTTATRYSLLGSITEYTDTKHVDYTDINPTLISIELGISIKPFGASRNVQDW